MLVRNPPQRRNHAHLRETKNAQQGEHQTAKKADLTVWLD